MILQPLDIVVAVKLAVWSPRIWTYQTLADELGINPAGAYRAVRNAARGTLLVPTSASRRGMYRAHHAAIVELLVHGVKYVYVPDRSGITRGIATAHAGPLLSRRIVGSDDPPPVWPDRDGDTRGEGISPLHPCVPRATRRDRRLYDVMTLVDALRIGRARERKLAAELLPEALRAA